MRVSTHYSSVANRTSLSGGKNKAGIQNSDSRKYLSEKTPPVPGKPKGASGLAPIGYAGGWKLTINRTKEKLIRDLVPDPNR